MNHPKLCSYCGIEPVTPFRKSYCSFCYYRFQRIRRMFARARKTPLVQRELHRTWNYWRRSPEWDALDALYVEPTEENEAAA